MEREIVELRKQLAEQATPTKINELTTPNATQAATYASEDQYGSNEAVEGLMGLSGGLNTLKRIEDVLVTQDCVTELFNMQVFNGVVGLDSKLIFPQASSPCTTPSSRFSLRKWLQKSISNTALLCSGP